MAFMNHYVYEKKNIEYALKITYIKINLLMEL